MKIVADPNIAFVREAFSALGEIEFVAGRQITSASVRDAELLLVRSVTPVNAALLEGSQVRFVATATIGTDHLDTNYLATRGIGFASAAGSNANSVAEYIVAALLEMAQRKGFRLRDKTLGIVGVGNVGSRVARYAQALQMSLLCNDPPRQRTQHLPHFTSLKNLLAESDILTFHVPLIDEGRDRTFHLLNEENFQTLKRKPILINSARGAIVDNEALLRSIRDQKLGGTVLDVWENEPDISNELLDAADLGTPHIAGYSLDGKLNGTIQILEAVCHFFGLPRKWEPADLIPPTPVPRMVIKPGHEDEETVLGKTIKHIYNICDDDSTLRRNPARFDRLRAEYPLRREFIHTELVLVEAKQTLRTKFQSIGFRVTNSSQS